MVECTWVPSSVMRKERKKKEEMETEGLKT